ncbi:MAG: methyltransferase domain-containing protein [Polyangiales bacterium]
MRETVLTDAEGHEFELRAIHCPVCGPGGERELGLRGGKHHRYRRGVETRIVECGRCGLLYANPFPFPRKPHELYGDPDKYFGSHDEGQKVENSQHIFDKARTLLRSPLSSLLDVGSGRGEVLVAGRRAGVNRVVGLEFAPAMVEYVKKKHGLEVLLLGIEEYAAQSPSPFDLIVLNAVLEHVYDPDKMIQACADMTRPGSILYVDTPNETSLLAQAGNAFNRVRRDPAVFNLSPTWPPFHVFGFNPRSMRILLEKHGFEVLETIVWAAPKVPHRPRDTRDFARAFVATQVNRLANVIGRASNFVTWARKK